MTNIKKNHQNGKNTLVQHVFKALSALVTNGRMVVGDKLPSEAKLVEQFAVSRTVIREAVAMLSSEGLVEARRGSGIYITNTRVATVGPFKIDNPENLSATLEILELRTAVEVEAAILAAQRRAPAQEQAIFTCLMDLDKAIAAKQPTAALDFAFHLAIAEASNNPQFVHFLRMMDIEAIPRSRLSSRYEYDGLKAYLTQLQKEHYAVADAIVAQQPEAANQAMRAHLHGSQRRYRTLLRKLPQ